MSLPNNLNFQNIRPKGYSSQIKLNQYQPSQGQGSFNPGDYIRFNIQTDGYWNPYCAYLIVDVKFTGNTPDRLTLDSTAHSLFTSLVITCNGTEIERIDEYDTLANMLYDLNYDNIQRNGLYYEGIAMNTQATTATISQQRQGSTSAIDSTNSSTTYSTTLTQSGNSLQNTPFMGQQYGTEYQKLDNVPNINAYSETISNCLPFSANGGNSNSGPFNYYPLQYNLQQSLHRTNIEVKQMQNVPYPLQYNQYVQPSAQNNYLYSAINFAELSLDAQSDELVETGITSSQKMNFYQQLGSIDAEYQCVKQNGFSKQFNPLLSAGTEFQFNAPYSIQNGSIKDFYNQNGVSGTQVQRFCIPIMSSIFGILIPQSQYKYIPMKYFPNIQLEFRTSQYAFYTAGYNCQTTLKNQGTGDQSQYNLNSQTDYTFQQQNRTNWQIINTTLKVEQIYYDKFVDDLIDSQIQQGGINLNSVFYQLGPMTNLQSTSQVQGDFQVNLGYQSLKSISMLILDNSYRQYSFCRKQFRLSGNITSMQFKFNNTYIPSQPIIGHGGNYKGIMTNCEYILQTKKAYGRLWDVLDSNNINPLNFSINCRPYDPSNMNKLYNTDVFNTKGTDTIINIDTHMHMPLFWEKAVIGSAIYSFEFDTMGQESSIWGGINTMSIRPWDILLQSDQTNVNTINNYTAPITLYIFCQYDGNIKINGIGSFEITGK